MFVAVFVANGETTLPSGGRNAAGSACNATLVASKA